jgi:hypothetical protein
MGIVWSCGECQECENQNAKRMLVCKHVILATPIRIGRRECSLRWRLSDFGFRPQKRGLCLKLQIVFWPKSERSGFNLKLASVMVEYVIQMQEVRQGGTGIKIRYPRMVGRSSRWARRFFLTTSINGLWRAPRGSTIELWWPQTS